MPIGCDRGGPCIGPCIGGVWICGEGNPCPGGPWGKCPMGCWGICCMWCGEYCGRGPPAMGCGGGNCWGICCGICCGGGWGCCGTPTPAAPACSINWQRFSLSVFFSNNWSFLASSTRRSAISYNKTYHNKLIILKLRTPEKIAVINLNFVQGGFIIE